MEKYLNKVNDFYSHDKNMYHTIYHVIDLYFLLDCYKEEFINEFPDLDIESLKEAIAWHDSFYIPGFSENEEKSVELYLKNGGRNQVVIDAILSTKSTNKIFKGGVQKVLHDIDWNGFRSYPTMLMNEEKILFESTYNGRYPVSLVKENQIKFYRSIDIENGIYVTNAFKIFNKEVKQNIECRLKGE